MRVRTPASRGSFRIRLSVFDAVWALLTPWLAILIRDVGVLSPDKLQAAWLYGLISFAFAIIAFVAFRIRDGMTRYFSVHDALDVAKAVAVSELLTCSVLFTLTRLDGIPRSTPLIHALVLGAGLVVARTLVRVFHAERAVMQAQHESAEHIVVIGSSQLSSLYMKLLETYAPGQRRVIAVLDDRPEMIGRSVAGVRIIGPPQHLQPVIDEFIDHGIRVDRVIIGGDADMLPKAVMDEIRRVCRRRSIGFDLVTRLLGLNEMQSAPAAQLAPPAKRSAPKFTPPAYFRIKRFIDFVVAMILSLVFFPLFLLTGLVVLIDVGSPVLFWQRRIGMDGVAFELHKFRSLKPSFDWRGQPVPDTDRLSWVGSLLRRFHLDEIPQLLNVLVGDMSLIGPRPLLPHDQPPNPSLRLTVRPGITGWAQVNGGALLTADEKNALDEWYIRNASPWLDLKIAIRTVLFVLGGATRTARGDARPSKALPARPALRAQPVRRRASNQIARRRASQA